MKNIDDISHSTHKPGFMMINVVYVQLKSSTIIFDYYYFTKYNRIQMYFKSNHSQNTKGNISFLFENSLRSIIELVLTFRLNTRVEKQYMETL